MKLAKIVMPIVDLAEDLSVSIVTGLKKNDIVVYEGEEWSVELPPKKVQKGVWWIGLVTQTESKYVKIVEDVSPHMTAHEKKTMIRNINGIVEMFDEKRLVKIAVDYYNNLSVHNRYDNQDVRDCMSKFPITVLKRSGITL